MDNKLSANIRRLRLDAGMTQGELAKKIDSSIQAISHYEAGNRVPPLDILLKIAKYFGISLDQLVGLKDLQPAAPDDRSVRIPVLGSIHAGNPAPAYEDRVDDIEIPHSWTRGGKDFVGLLVTGDSMVPDYQPGDYVILEITVDFNSGDDVVVYIDGYDSTLKRARKIGNRVIFYPLNDKYAPITCGPSEHSFKVFGVVKELRRKR